jgi:hypothetical protein
MGVPFIASDVWRFGCEWACRSLRAMYGALGATGLADLRVVCGVLGANERAIHRGRRVALWEQLGVPFLRVACGVLGANGRAIHCGRRVAFWEQLGVPFVAGNVKRFECDWACRSDVWHALA